MCQKSILREPSHHLTCPCGQHTEDATQAVNVVTRGQARSEGIPLTSDDDPPINSVPPQQTPTVSRHRAGRRRQRIVPLVNYGARKALSDLSRIPHFTPTKRDIECQQESDPLCASLLTYIRTRRLPTSQSMARQVLLQHDNFIEIDGILFHLSRDMSSKFDKLVAQVVVPQVWVPKILGSYHDIPIGGHIGVMKLLSVLRERFYWEGMNKDVREYVATCHECLQSKKPRNKIIAPMTLRDKATRPFQVVTMDTIGPVHRSSSRKMYIHVCVDFFSKFLIAWSSTSIDAATTAKGFYEHVIAIHGVPQKLCTDNGTSYTGQVFKDACRQFGINQIFSSSWHPQSQGLVERANQSIIAGLRTFVDKAQKNWDVYLPAIAFAYNMSDNTHHGAV